MARVAQKQRGSLHIWFDPEPVWLAEPSGKRGRSATFSDAAIQACLTLKGEGRPGNDPVDRFSPERAAPGDGSGCHCGRSQGSSGTVNHRAFHLGIPSMGMLPRGDLLHKDSLLSLVNSWCIMRL